MFKIIFILLFINIGFSQDFEIKKLNDGSQSYFKIDKIYPNPMSNPSNIFTNFNLPDTLDIYLAIVNNKNQTILDKTISLCEPGEYQLHWNYKCSNKIKGGKHFLIFKALINSEVIYSSVISFIVFK